MSENRLNKLIDLVKKHSSHIEELNYYIKENRKERLREFLKTTDKERQRKRDVCTVYKRERKIDEDRLENVLNQINGLCTFDMDEFIDFLTDVISITEKETYLKTVVNVLNRQLYNNNHDDVLLYDLNKADEYYVVAPAEEINKLNKSDHLLSVNSDNSTLNSKKCIIIRKNKYYNIYDKNVNGIKKEITAFFPYLEEVLEKIIDAKVEFSYDGSYILSAYVEAISSSYNDSLLIQKENIKQDR